MARLINCSWLTAFWKPWRTKAAAVGLDDGPRSFNGEDPKALERLALDVDWFRPQALVVMTTNNSLDAGVLNESWPQTLALVWNVAPRYDLQPQLGVAEANRGPAGAVQPQL